MWGQNLVPEGWGTCKRLFCQTKHSLVYSCIFPECAAPTHWQGTGNSRDLDLCHLSHWWFKTWLCQEYIHITCFFFSCHLYPCFSYSSNKPSVLGRHSECSSMLNNEFITVSTELSLTSLVSKQEKKINARIENLTALFPESVQFHGKWL